MGRLRELVERLKPIAYCCYFDEEKRHDVFLKVGAELISNKCEILTFWFYWDHDAEGDEKDDWEPLNFILKNDRVVGIQSRPHWLIVGWETAPPIFSDDGKAIVYFHGGRHAPYLYSNPKKRWMMSNLRRAAPEFVLTFHEKDKYRPVREYTVKENHGPPTNSPARMGILFRGIPLSSRGYYKLPKQCK